MRARSADAGTVPGARHRVKLSWRTSASLVVGTLVAGTLATTVLAMTLDREYGELTAEVMDRRVQVVERAVDVGISRYTDTADDLAASIGAQNELTATDFVSLTANLDRSRLPGISGVSLVVPATDAQIPRVQREWRSRGSEDLVLDPAEVDRGHLFVVLSRALDLTPPTLGRDVAQAAEPTAALRTARRRDLVTASATYVLLKDRELPVAEQQLSFIITAPVRGSEGTADAGRFRGWLVMSLRGSDFIEQTMLGASQRAVSVTLLDRTGSTADAVSVATSGGDVLDDTRLGRMVNIPVAGRTWELQVRPTTRFALTVGRSPREPAGIVGLLVTLLLAVLVGTLSSSRTRALARVDNATAALRSDIEQRERVEAALREREEQLRTMALTDPLTGLANRRAFMDTLDRSLAQAARRTSSVSVLFGDVNHFKAINDTHGHAAGDAVLAQVAERLRGHFRLEDTVGRLGGDEFAVVIDTDSPPDTSPPDASLLDRLHDVLSAPYDVRGTPVLATVSVGMASAEAGETSEQVLERADRTMYRTKAAQRVT